MSISSELGCIKVVDSDLPDKIVDLSTMTLSATNQGVFTLSINMLVKPDNASGGLDEFAGTNFSNFQVSRSRFFHGYIREVNPQPYEGTEYINFRILAEGVVC